MVVMYQRAVHDEKDIAGRVILMLFQQLKVTCDAKGPGRSATPEDADDAGCCDSPMKTQRQAVRLLRATALSTFLGLGMTILTSPVYAANFNVGSDADLRSAISSAGNGDTITFTANITLTGNLPNVTTNVTFVGGDHTLSGDNQYRGLFVQSGTVAISNLTITGALAQGGSGGSGYRGGGGGGGAGLGGALFVANGAHVTVDNVNLQSSAARGGAGGDGTGSGVVATSGGGGGYWPTGANGGNAGPFSSGGGGTGGGWRRR
ncbi:hypothetical protein ACFSKM_22560 [Ancylobacter dichloromethanicus]